MYLQYTDWKASIESGSLAELKLTESTKLDLFNHCIRWMKTKDAVDNAEHYKKFNDIDVVFFNYLDVDNNKKRNYKMYSAYMNIVGKPINKTRYKSK